MGLVGAYTCLMLISALECKIVMCLATHSFRRVSICAVAVALFHFSRAGIAADYLSPPRACIRGAVRFAYIGIALAGAVYACACSFIDNPEWAGARIQRSSRVQQCLADAGNTYARISKPFLMSHAVLLCACCLLTSRLLLRCGLSLHWILLLLAMPTLYIGTATVLLVVGCTEQEDEDAFAGLARFLLMRRIRMAATMFVSVFLLQLCRMGIDTDDLSPPPDCFSET